MAAIHNLKHHPFRVIEGGLLDRSHRFVGGKELTTRQATRQGPSGRSAMYLVVVQRSGSRPIESCRIVVSKTESQTLLRKGYLLGLTLIADGRPHTTALYTPREYLEFLSFYGHEQTILDIIYRSTDPLLILHALRVAEKHDLAVKPQRLEEILAVYSEDERLKRAALLLMGNNPRHEATLRVHAGAGNDQIRATALRSLIKLGHTHEISEAIRSLSDNADIASCLTAFAQTQAGKPAHLRTLADFFRSPHRDLALRLAANYFGVQGKWSVLRFLARLPETEGERLALALLKSLPPPKKGLALYGSERHQWQIAFALDRKNSALSPLTLLWSERGGLVHSFRRAS